MSTTFPIENIGQSPARKYGQVIQPGESAWVEQDTIFTWSVMEIARDLHIVAEKLTSIESMMSKDHAHSLHERLNKTDKDMHVTHTNQVFKVESTPWIIQKYRQWQSRRDFKRRMKARSQPKEAA